MDLHIRCYFIIDQDFDCYNSCSALKTRGSRLVTLASSRAVELLLCRPLTRKIWLPWVLTALNQIFRGSYKELLAARHRERQHKPLLGWSRVTSSVERLYVRCCGTVIFVICFEKVVGLFSLQFCIYKGLARQGLKRTLFQHIKKFGYHKIAYLATYQYFNILVLPIVSPWSWELSGDLLVSINAQIWKLTNAGPSCRTVQLCINLRANTLKI
jgi:hypothetical protein